MAFKRLADLVLGRHLASDEEEEHKAGVVTGIPMLGLDALGSSSYGPEAALTVLLPLGALGLRYIGPITLVILAILGIVYFSYRQTIAAYPNGGGSYTVARENLGVRMGLLAAAALLLDYILNVAVGISAGVGALVSAVPSLHPYLLQLCLGMLLVIVVVNLRGVRESGLAFAAPTYAFIVLLGGVLAWGIYQAWSSGGHPRPVVAPAPLPSVAEGATWWLLLRAFASGCTAMTGVEAVSNGVTAFAEPRTRNAQATLTAIVAVLAVLLGGIAYLAHVYHIGATPPDTPQYQSVVSQLVAAIAGRGVIYYATLGSVLAVLGLSANTSFSGFPRLCRLLAEDDFLPHAFANRGRRLVYELGIWILAALAALLLILFRGVTDRLIPLFAVGAFLAFTLSQAGMVLHWRRQECRGARWAMVVNGVGALATGAALLVILGAKFTSGAWITMLLIPAMMWVFQRVHRHYACLREEIRCPRPIQTDRLQPPLVILPMLEWNTIAEKALRFALQLSGDVVVVHVCTDDANTPEFQESWDQLVEEPLRAAGMPVPELKVLHSPYRLLTSPLLRYLRRLQKEHADRTVAVVIPELVEARWYQYLLHNQTAELLRAALLLRGNRRTVVINVPWYFRDSEPETADTSPARVHGGTGQRAQPG